MKPFGPAQSTIKILIATFNPGKMTEIQALLGGHFLLISLRECDMSIPFDETGSTFRENAVQKSCFYSSRIRDILTVAEDSGLVVETLGGEPGVRSARFAGDESGDSENIQKLLQKMKSRANRAAAFVAVVALSRNGKLIRCFEGRVEGELLDSPRGKNGFGYDPVFFFPQGKKTFAQLTREQKNEVSHRGRAFRQLRDYLLNLESI